MSGKIVASMQTVVKLLPINTMFTAYQVHRYLLAADIQVSSRTVATRMHTLRDGGVIHLVNNPEDKTNQKYYVYKAVEGTHPELCAGSTASTCFSGSVLSDAARKMLHGKLV